MWNISKDALERLRKDYPIGCRVELTKMSDPFRTDLVPGCRGTVKCVDDTGSIHVHWDIGSSLAVIYGEDACRRLYPVSITCYSETEVWDDRMAAIKFYKRGAEECDGSESRRYSNIVFQLMDGKTECFDTIDEEDD